MIEKANRISHTRARGHEEGVHDYLFENPHTTIEDRATRAFYDCGMRAYKKYFVLAYIEAAKKAEASA